MNARIERIITGDYVSPGGPRSSPGERVVAVAYLVRHPEANVLFDTGFPFDEPFSVEEDGIQLYTYPRSLMDALAESGLELTDLDAVVNCHLHIDHAGGNFRLPSSLPIYVQSVELAAARSETDDLVRDALAVETHSYIGVDGEHDLLPGLRLVPTPGHTDGHHSLLVTTADGPWLLAGQALPTASDFASAMYAWRVAAEGYGQRAPYPEWLERIVELHPARVAMAHDLAVWERDF